jgi:hypothetical protein
VKQSPSVEIAYLLQGDEVSVRRLSARTEWRAATSVFGLVAGLSAAAGLTVALALLAAHRVLYGPAYAGLWAAVGLGAATLAATRAFDRARRYRIGTSVDDDAFAASPMSLVYRTRAGYRLTLAPGFTGRIGDDRAPLPVETLVRGSDGAPVEVALEEGTRAELILGPSTFVVTSLREEGRTPLPPRGFVKRFARRAFVPLELCALASLFCAVPVGAQIGEAEMSSAIPASATPWEIEKALRAEAQRQAQSLHQCFDVLPISCQRSGYVGVGVSLSRDGEMRDHWISRSTYGADCPVEQCMADIVSTWFFEPIPESIRVILPVQVLRTDRPLPYGPARTAEDSGRSQARQQVLESRVN